VNRDKPSGQFHRGVVIWESKQPFYGPYNRRYSLFVITTKRTVLRWEAAGLISGCSHAGPSVDALQKQAGSARGMRLFASEYASKTAGRLWGNNRFLQLLVDFFEFRRGKVFLGDRGKETGGGVLLIRIKVELDQFERY
jgi:hypothetical protein